MFLQFKMFQFAINRRLKTYHFLPFITACGMKDELVLLVGTDWGQSINEKIGCGLSPDSVEFWLNALCLCTGYVITIKGMP